MVTICRYRQFPTHQSETTTRRALSLSHWHPPIIHEFILECPSSMGKDRLDRQPVGMPDPGKKAVMEVIRPTYSCLPESLEPGSGADEGRLIPPNTPG